MILLCIFYGFCMFWSDAFFVLCYSANIKRIFFLTYSVLLTNFMYFLYFYLLLKKTISCQRHIFHVFSKNLTRDKGLKTINQSFVRIRLPQIYTISKWYIINNTWAIRKFHINMRIVVFSINNVLQQNFVITLNLFELCTWIFFKFPRIIFVWIFLKSSFIENIFGSKYSFSGWTKFLMEIFSIFFIELYNTWTFEFQ